MTNPDSTTPTEQSAVPSAPAMGSVSPEQWWTRHAELLAIKMMLGGVKSFRIELNARGNYDFEAVPTETLNARISEPPHHE